MISNSPEGCVVDIVLSDSIHDRYIFIIIIIIYFVTVFLFCLCETSLLMYAGTDAAPRRASPIGILYSDIVCLFSSVSSYAL